MNFDNFLLFFYLDPISGQASSIWPGFAQFMFL